MIVQNPLKFIGLLFLATQVLCLGATRIAVLSSFSNEDSRDSSRMWLAGFDAKLQAELLTDWDCEVLSRSGLSAVVFEQKLAAAKDPKVAPPLVLPADALVITVLDTKEKQLRIHVTRVSEKMALSPPMIFRYQNIGELLGKIPREAAAYLAKVADLKPLEISKNPSSEPSLKVTCALIDPISAQGRGKNTAGLAALFRASLEQEIANLAQPVELVEREKITTLIEETMLAASGAGEANASTNIGRLVGADLILMPHVYGVSEDSIQSTLFAIDVKSGRILAARTWKGQPLDPPPAGVLSGLLSHAVQAISAGGKAIADIPAMRHAEASFIVQLKDSFGELRQARSAEAELAMNLADAALALAHDDAALMRNVIAEYGYAAIPKLPTKLEQELHPNTYGLREILALVKSGQLAELHEQGRRIFGLALLDVRAGDWDLHRLAMYFNG